MEYQSMYLTYREKGERHAVSAFDVSTTFDDDTTIKFGIVILEQLATDEDGLTKNVPAITVVQPRKGGDIRSETTRVAIDTFDNYANGERD